ncbi:hypothetical protein F5Y18DRAFT_211321 [Xylariaceae sp. FL1019]|nr:hypothetical protein F5Y18DRAFT_211321 [Xylariaceae sp. FL1019]
MISFLGIDVVILTTRNTVLLFKRFYNFTKKIRGVVPSHSQASIQANNTRRRLYNLSFAILAAYVPLMVYLAVINVQSTIHSYKPYDFHRIRYSAAPYPWDSVLFVPSWMIPDVILNQAWLTIATALAIFLVFGTTRDALDIYRKYAKATKLDVAWNKLLLWTRLGGRRPSMFPTDEELKRDRKRKGKQPVRVQEEYVSPFILPSPPSSSFIDSLVDDLSSSTPRVRRSRSTLQSDGSHPSYTDGSIQPLDSRHPPVIPPRRSSLRHAMPAFPPRARLPSLPSISGSISRGFRDFSETSSAILRGTSNDIPMLPLNRRMTNRTYYNSLDDSSPRLPPFHRGGDSFFSSEPTQDPSSPVTPAAPHRLTLGPDFYSESYDFENNAIITEGPRVGEIEVRVPIIRNPSVNHESTHLSQLPDESTGLRGSLSWASMSSTLSDILNRVGITR